MKLHDIWTAWTLKWKSDIKTEPLNKRTAQTHPSFCQGNWTSCYALVGPTTAADPLPAIFISLNFLKASANVNPESFTECGICPEPPSFRDRMPNHQADFVESFCLFVCIPSASFNSVCPSRISTNSSREAQSFLKKFHGKSENEIVTCRIGSNKLKPPFVIASAGTFSSLGLQRNLIRSPLARSSDDTCMCSASKGHLVDMFLFWRPWLALLSVPPVMASLKFFEKPFPSKCPK